MPLVDLFTIDVMSKMRAAGVRPALTKVDETQSQCDEPGPFVAQGALQTLHQGLNNSDGDITVGGTDKDHTESEGGVGRNLHRGGLIGDVRQQLVGNILSARTNASKSDTDITKE